MRPTKLLIFGSPKAGTPLMIASPSVAIDLPLKVLVSEDANGKVWISSNPPAYVQAPARFASGSRTKHRRGRSAGHESSGITGCTHRKRSSEKPSGTPRACEECLSGQERSQVARFLIPQYAVKYELGISE